MNVNKSLKYQYTRKHSESRRVHLNGSIAWLLNFPIMKRYMSKRFLLPGSQQVRAFNLFFFAALHHFQIIGATNCQPACRMHLIMGQLYTDWEKRLSNLNRRKSSIICLNTWHLDYCPIISCKSKYQSNWSDGHKKLLTQKYYKLECQLIFFLAFALCYCGVCRSC